jgi:hypothetical protein
MIGCRALRFGVFPDLTVLVVAVAVDLPSGHHHLN